MEQTRQGQCLCMLFRNGTSLPLPERTIQGPPLPLSETAAKVLTRTKPACLKVRPLSKDNLCIITAKLIYPQRLHEWHSTCGVEPEIYYKLPKPAGNSNEYQKLDGIPHWFSYPEFNTRRQQIEPKLLDAHHLFVNVRVKMCKDGLPGYGLDK